MLYAWAAARYRQRRIQLPTEDVVHAQTANEAEEDDDDAAKAQPAGRALRGWAVLLLWLPAACDLTGTTVRAPPSLSPSFLSFSLTIPLFSASFSYIYAATHERGRFIRNDGMKPHPGAFDERRPRSASVTAVASAPSPTSP